MRRIKLWIGKGVIQSKFRFEMGLLVDRPGQGGWQHRKTFFLSILVEKCPWFYLPPSVHKIVLHASTVMEDAIVSEEDAEAKKDIKRYKLQHT